MATVVGESDDLAQLQLAAEQADAVVRELVHDLAAIEDGAVLAELPAQALARVALAVGEDVEAVGEQLLEQAGAPSAAVEHDRHAAVADERADIAAQRRQHLHQAGVGLGGDHEQRLAGGVVDPVVGGRRHRDPHARDVPLGQL